MESAQARVRSGRLIALALLLLAAADPQDEAKDAFQRGLSAFDRARYHEALELFERSLLLRETATVWYNLALTHYRLGRYDAALGALERYGSLERSPDRSQQQQLDDMTRELKKRLALLEITALEPTTKISLDGREVRAGPIHVMPGLHTLEAQRPLHRPLSKRINVGPGDRLSIDMSPMELLRASIVVRATPEDAEVSIDGTVVGVGTYRGELPPGPHEISAKTKDRMPAIERVELAPDETKEVRLVLIEEPPPVYATWWFWTIAGVVVVGAAVAVGVAATPGYDKGNTGIVVEALHP